MSHFFFFLSRVFFVHFCLFLQKILAVSRIQTRIVRAEGENADHSTTLAQWIITLSSCCWSQSKKKYGKGSLGQISLWRLLSIKYKLGHFMSLIKNLTFPWVSFAPNAGTIFTQRPNLFLRQKSLITVPSLNYKDDSLFSEVVVKWQILVSLWLRGPLINFASVNVSFIRTCHFNLLNLCQRSQKRFRC